MRFPDAVRAVDDRRYRVDRARMRRIVACLRHAPSIPVTDDRRIDVYPALLRCFPMDKVVRLCRSTNVGVGPDAESISSGAYELFPYHRAVVESGRVPDELPWLWDRFPRAELAEDDRWVEREHGALSDGTLLADSRVVRGRMENDPMHWPDVEAEIRDSLPFAVACWDRWSGLTAKDMITASNLVGLLIMNARDWRHDWTGPMRSARYGVRSGIRYQNALPFRLRLESLGPREAHPVVWDWFPDPTGHRIVCCSSGTTKRMKESTFQRELRAL